MEELEDEEEILMDHCPYVISFLTEFLGMAIQMFVGCLGSIDTYNMGPFISAFSFGLGRLACYEMFNHISPVHVNPAKSFGFYVLGRMHLLRLVVYIIAQYSGSIAGVAFVMAVIPKEIDDAICVNHLHEVETEQGFAIEFTITAILMLSVAGATDPVNEKVRDSLGLRIGFIVSGLILVIDNFTHAGKNPSRSLAPSWLYNRWQDHWLYQVAPFCGATFGALLYRFVFEGHHKHSLHGFLYRRAVRRSARRTR